MSKIKKEIIVNTTPKDDWDMDFWTVDMFKRHESDFQRILVEYKNLKENYFDEIRFRWLESKNAVSINKDGVSVIVSKYSRYSNMFAQFTNWLYYKEKMENTPEKLSEMKNAIKPLFTGTDFGIPKSIMEGMNRDLEFDKIKQIAIDSF